MAQIFPIDFDEKLTIAQDDFILFSDSEDGNKIKKAQYSNLKWEKWDTGTAATITVWSTTTWTPGSSASVVNSWTTSAAVLDFTIPEWEKGDTWDTGASIISAEFDWDDMVFTKDDWDTVTLTDAKVDLKWDTWDAATISVGTTTTLTPGSSATVTNSWTSWAAVFNFWIPKGEKWDTWDTWATWPTWAKINSASFSGDDMVFGLTDSSTVTLTWAKTTLTWPQGETGPAATISVWTTTTWEPGTNASVTNSWTSGAAVFNFTIPKGAKGDTGSTGPAATITVWSTITWDAWTSATVTNSGTSSAAVLDFTIPKWDKWDTWNTWATGNWIASVTSSKSWKVTTVTITETDWDSTSFQVSDGADGEWSWDVVWPNSSTDWNVVLFDWATGKLIKDSWKAFTAAGIWALADSTKYWKTLDLSIDSTTYVVTATLKDQDWTTLSTDTIDLPLESVVVWGSYDAVNKKVVLTLENGNTVEFSVADLVAWLQSEITSSNKLDADLVDDSTSTNKFVTAANKTTWNWKQDALIAWTNITIAADWKTISATDTTYSAATSSTLWLVKLWDDTVQSVAANAVTGTASRTYAMQVNSSGQLVVNVPREDHTYTASDFDIKNLADSTGLRTTWSWKQDALTTQTAYTTKGTSTKVATISTNTLWQVTAITETSIDFPVTSVNGGTGAVTWLQTTANLKTDLTDNSDSYYPSQKAVKTAVDAKQATLVSWTNIKTINWNDILGSWDLTVSGLPAWWTEWQILMIVNWTPTWVTPAAKWFKMLSPNSPLTVPYDWYGTEAQYSSATKSSDTEYRTV